MDCSTFAFDLHVLGTPPALILSQDQTLKLKWFARLRCALRRNFGEAILLTRAPVDLLALRCWQQDFHPAASIVEYRRAPESKPHAPSLG